MENTKIFGFIDTYNKSTSEEIQINSIINNVNEIIKSRKLTKNEKWEMMLDEKLKKVRTGDTLIIYSLAILNLPTIKLIHFINNLNNKKIQFISVSENWDSSNENWTLFANNLKDIIEIGGKIKKTIASELIGKLKSNGITGGKEKGYEILKNADKPLAAKRRYTEGMAVSKICKETEISRSTLYRYLRNQGVVIGNKKRVQ